jgi:TatD DNase family protein
MQYFNLHTHHFTDQEPVVELVNQYPWEFDERIKTYSIGIHPWYIKLERIASDSSNRTKDRSRFLPCYRKRT